MIMHLLTQQLSMRQFLANHAILAHPQPPYSPDLSPSNRVSKSGKGGGKGALLRKGTILKGIIINKL
jgi:hypothetical protein